MAQVELKNLCKRYGETTVVHGVDLVMDENEFIVLVGPSGCGKSTILRMIAGLESISDGEIFINGRLVNGVSPKERNVAMVFQNYALYPHMTVRENVGFSLKMAKRSRREIEQAVNQAAEILELGPYLDRKPAALSGGQRQRVAMGRAIVRRPDVFLFDEPLSNLDAQLRTQMRMELKKLHLKFQTPTIYVTHDQIEAMTLADRIVILKNGHIQQIGAPVDVFENPVNVFTAKFIGNPPMNILGGTCRMISGERFIEINSLLLPLPDRWQSAFAEDAPVLAGLRPDAVKTGESVVRVPENWRFEGRVEVAEVLGGQSLLELTVGGAAIIAEVEGRVLARHGDVLPLGFELERLILFDPKTNNAFPRN